MESDWQPMGPLGQQLRKIYDLREDSQRMQLMQKRAASGAAFSPRDPIPIGTDDWWNAIETGQIELHVVEGRIEAVYMSGHNDFPSFSVKSQEVITTWPRVGNDAEYQPGRLCRIEYVERAYERQNPQLPFLHTVLRVWIE